MTPGAPCTVVYPIFMADGSAMVCAFSTTTAANRAVASAPSKKMMRMMILAVAADE